MYNDSSYNQPLLYVYTCSHKFKLTQTQAEMDKTWTSPLLLPKHRVILVQGNPPAAWDSMLCISSATNEIVLQWT